MSIFLLHRPKDTKAVIINTRGKSSESEYKDRVEIREGENGDERVIV